MRPEQVERWITEVRFRSYFDAREGDHDRAVALYNWNAEISAAFLEVLYHVEVLLRNAIDQQFPRAPAADAMVSICQPDVWLTDPALLEAASRERVNDAIARIITGSDKRPTRDRVVAALPFGFWRALFIGRYEELWRSHLRHAFPNGNGRRKQVNELLARILPFRNRVAHHEAIFALDLAKQHENLLALTALTDEEARGYVAALSRVPKLLAEEP